jgi:hypothetical protein
VSRGRPRRLGGSAAPGGGDLVGSVSRRAAGARAASPCRCREGSGWVPPGVETVSTGKLLNCICTPRVFSYFKREQKRVCLMNSCARHRWVLKNIVPATVNLCPGLVEEKRKKRFKWFVHNPFRLSWLIASKLNAHNISQSLARIDHLIRCHAWTKSSS